MTFKSSLAAALLLAGLLVSPPIQAQTEGGGCSVLYQGGSLGLPGSTKQLGTVLQDGAAGTCANKAYPGQALATTLLDYYAHTFTNPLAEAMCVTLDFEQSFPCQNCIPCEWGAHPSVYLDAYDPADQARNFLGDLGAYDNVTFSFSVPARRDFVVVVADTVDLTGYCDYAFRLESVPCGVSTSSGPAPTEVPAAGGAGLLVLSAGLLASAIGALRVGRRRVPR